MTNSTSKFTAHSGYRPIQSGLVKWESVAGPD